MPGRLSRRVVVTGYGVISPCGLGKDAFWEGLLGPNLTGGSQARISWDPLPFFENAKEARRAEARKEMVPHVDEVARYRELAVAARDKIGVMKRAKATELDLDALRDQLATAEKSARDAQAKADSIDATVFDLKAVNPRVRVEQDTRTPTEILEAIAAQGRTVESALERLRRLILEPAPTTTES